MGLMILGIPCAFINVPAICDMIDTLKSKKGYDEESANNLASALYNLAINLGESIGPTLGGYISNKRDFVTSCIYVSFLNLTYSILFCGYNFKSIIEYVLYNDKEIIPVDIVDLGGDFIQSTKTSRSQSIAKRYLGRGRSYSRGSSMSRGLIKK
jgi:hypothetical protein